MLEKLAAYTKGCNPVTLGALAVIMVGPTVYTEIQTQKREDRRREEEEFKNTQTFYDSRIDHRYTLKRQPTEDEWIEIGNRYFKESGGAILRDLDLI